MLDYQKIIDHYYKNQEELRQILLVHSSCVAKRATKIVDNHPEFGIDRDFVYAAAMLHDIGIIRCDADGILCFGHEPYLCHGIIGAQMLRADAEIFGLEAEEAESYARVCERHTGTGLSLEQIQERGLPLPHRDFMPESMAEQIICYADKFYSKTHPEREKSFEQAEQSLAKFGQAGVEKFNNWKKIFE